jgi:hypothetical protein
MRNIALAIATPAVCAVSGTTVTHVSAGTYYVYANQAGNLSYSALEHRMLYSSPNQLLRFEAESAQNDEKLWSLPYHFSYSENDSDQVNPCPSMTSSCICFLPWLLGAS